MVGAQKIFFDDFSSVYEEAKRRRKFLAENGIGVRVEKSPYGGGYRFRRIPVAALISAGIPPTRLTRDYGGDDGRKEKYAF